MVIRTPRTETDVVGMNDESLGVEHKAVSTVVTMIPEELAIVPAKYGVITSIGETGGEIETATEITADRCHGTNSIPTVGRGPPLRLLQAIYGD